VNGFYYNRLPCDVALVNSRELFSTNFHHKTFQLANV